MYNCFLNCKVPIAFDNKNRVFTSLDIFPTVLSALGFEYEGDRLGLGTNLFSDTPTIAEDIGFDMFDQELSRRSDYYLKNFQ